MKIHEQFVIMRKSLGLRQEDIAIACDVTTNTVGNWEQGHTDLPARVWVAVKERYEKEGAIKLNEPAK